MMSSLLFYHKKENPLTGVIDSEGCGGLKRFCSELSSALRTTLRVNLASPGGRDGTPLCHPSGCDGSRIREAHRFLRPCLLTQHTLDSFPDYRLVKSDQGRTDALCRTRGSAGFGVAQTPTVYFRVINYFLPWRARAASRPRAPAWLAASWSLRSCSAVA